MGKKLTISESEQNNIREMYQTRSKKQEHVFSASITVDGRYVIICDDVYDNYQQKSIGNLWESLDTIKTIFQNVKIDNHEFNVIRENIVSLPIIEGKTNLYELRDILLEFNFLNDTWVGNQLKNSGKGISQFASSSVSGLSKFGVTVSQGDWSNVLSMMLKGIRFILRGLKDALYSPVGMTVDAILVAMGIGKTVQWIPWALVASLDVYQLLNNDWPPEEKDNPMWMKYLTIGFDVLGLVSTGLVAKAARMEAEALKVARTPEQIAQVLKENPNLKKYIVAMINGSQKVPGYLKSASTAMSKNFPSGSKFIESIISSSSSVSQEMSVSLNSILGTGAKTGGILYGTEKGIEYGTKKYTQYLMGLSNKQMTGLDALNDYYRVNNIK